MNKIENGILKINNIEKIGIGTHYYPSYHPFKVPVFDINKRLNEANLDIKEMSDLGFNIVRIASIGNIEKKDNSFICDTTFQDDLINIAKSYDLNVFVRLNGYSTNFDNIENSYLKDQNDVDIPEKWDYFIRNNLHNATLKKDDIDLSVHLARHYNKFNNVLAYQIYNEPAYPHIGFYSYNDETIKQWQTLNNHNKKPPRYRPSINDEEQFNDWLSFRRFCNDSINEYLNDISKMVHTQDTSNNTFTCLTPCGIQQGSSIRGTDYFKLTREMDFLGITLYLEPLGAKYYEYSRILDFSESVATQFNKHAWVIECDARTNLSAYDFEFIYYAILSSGIKGIMPYQFRGDIKLDNSPEPNRFGIINNDRTKTEKYDVTKKLHNLINIISTPLAKSERLTNNIAIFHSKESNLYCDALQNGNSLNSWKNKELSIILSNQIYYSLKKEHLSPFFVDYEGLKNRKIKLLLIPTLLGLTNEELDIINELSKEIEVRVYNPIINAYEKLDETDAIELRLLLKRLNIKPYVEYENDCLDIKIVSNEDNYFIFLLNHSIDKKTIKKIKLKLNLNISNNDEIKILNINRNEKLKMKNKKITIDELNVGSIIWIERRKEI